MLFRLHRFQKMITQIFLQFNVSNLCIRFIIGVIRDFRTFSEISLNDSRLEIGQVQLLTRTTQKCRLLYKTAELLILISPST
jgi:hypothetical protein